MGRPAVTSVLLAAALASACAGAPDRAAPDPLSPEAAADVLVRFCRALERERFEEAHALLSARWRAAYTPRRLAVDRGGASAVASEAAARVLAALAAGAAIERDGDRALLAVGPGRAAVLVAEDGRWRVDALE